MEKQLPLFEDKRALLNRGILELTRLNLDEAKKSFVDYKALYHQENAVDSEIKLTDFLMKGFADAPETCPEAPAYLCWLWTSFEDYVQSIGFAHEKIISGIKSSFFRKAVEAVEAFFKEKLPDLKAKLFFRGIILCDNEPLLRFMKRTSFIDVRRLMKEINPAQFFRYLRYVEGTDKYKG